MTSARHICLLRGRMSACVFLLMLWLLPAVPGFAAPLELSGRWFEASTSPAGIGPTPPAIGSLRPVARISPTGGHYVYEAAFEIERAGVYVLDFKNSSVVGRFRHCVVSESADAPVMQASGGITADEANPYFMRHGREFTLRPGRYRLVTEMASPFFLAVPEPYLDSLEHYRQAIKLGNVLVLLCLGLFIGLGAYYACLALVRRRLAEGLYVLFILGNLVYNSSALLVVHELFGASWFYLISAPILFSNIAYVLFVMVLLGIRTETAPRLYLLGRLLVGLLSVFVLVAAWRPQWSLELDRIGVGLFLVFGLSAGVLRALRGDKLARWYVVANIGFFVSGVAAISLASLQGVYSIYIEHIGLVAVTIEVLLLALVLSYQFGLLQQEKEHALATAERSLRIACTDALTELPNRYALEFELESLPPEGSLTFIDLDGLKHYNDHYGHARGDELLRAFAQELSRRLQGSATLHRLGGDEFAATSRSGDVAQIERMVGETIAALRRADYELSGASHGSVWVHECSDDRSLLKHISDTRMYEHKRRRQRDGLAAEETSRAEPPLTTRGNNP